MLTILNKSIVATSVLCLSALIATGCQSPEQSLTVTAGPGASIGLIRNSDPSKQVCNPLDPNPINPNMDPSTGLVGRIRYLPDAASGTQVANSLNDFEVNGLDAGVDVFLNQLNVPTRPFDRGFETRSGSMLKTPTGENLLEWFSLSMDTRIQLGANDEDGNYQFAILSDDGSIVQIDEGGGRETLIDDNHLTQTLMGCASRAVHLTHQSSLPMHIGYFQGPRYHIALMLLWRKLPSTLDGSNHTNDLSDIACGTSGNNLFFDSSQTPSAPSQYYLDLLGRGWKVVAPENFKLPGASDTNPCAKTCTGLGCGVLGQ